MTHTDEHLAELSRRGDRAAFEQLVRRTGRLVFAQLRPDCRDSHEAEDLTQETFLRAFRQIDRLQNPDKFRAWLLSIAAAVRVDTSRHRSRQKRGDRRTHSLSTVDRPAADPVDELAQIEQQQRALSILKNLPDEYRQPLSLRYLTGSDHETIGRQLGITNGSLRGLLHRGMAMLRERMKE